MTLQMLPARARLEDIQRLLIDPGSRQEISQLTGSLLKPGCRIGDLRITRAKYKPGGKLRAFFDVSVYLNSEGTQQVRPIAVTWQVPEEPLVPDGELEQAEAEIFRRNLEGPFMRLWADVPDRGIHIQVWPLDPEFPQIARLTDPTYLLKALSDPLNPAGDWEVVPVRYRPGERHVLQLSREGKGKPERLYAKLYREAEGARRAFRIATQVVDWLAEHVEGVSGIRPWGWRDEEAVVLYPHAPGVTLSSLLAHPGFSMREHLRQVGRALQALHQSPGSLATELKTNTLEREVHLVDRATQHVQAFLPEVGEAIRRSLNQVLEAGAELPGETPTFTHSDFKADHLLIYQDEITIIDFDTCAIADPAIDVGKFTADLEWWFVQAGRAGAELAQAAFLEGYARLVPPERLQRAQLYQALILIKITARRARLYDQAWTKLVTQLVHRAGEILRERISG